jgi:hypothetical protein
MHPTSNSWVHPPYFFRSDMYNAMYGTFLCLLLEPMGTGGCYDYLLMRGGAHNDVAVVVVGVVVVVPSAELAKTKQTKQ